MGGEDIYPQLSRFPNLRSFLIVTFPETDYEGLSDDDAAYHYIAENVPIVRESILKEGKALLAEPIIPWEEIGKAANRYFVNENEAKQWMIRIIHAVENIEPRIGKAFVKALPEATKVKLRQGYLQLFDFLLTQFPPNSYQKYSDEETARYYAAKVTSEQLAIVVKEGRALLLHNEFPWPEINAEAERFIAAPEDFREWLKKIIDILEKSGSRWQ